MLKSTQSHRVAAALAVSFLLRWLLIFRGGQYYFSDEQRYETSRTFVELLLSRNTTAAFTRLFTAPEHLGFKIIGIFPALIEQFTRESLVIPALFFSLFSVLNLYLIYQISRRVGVNDTESFTVLLFAASCMSLLYFSRHLVPYDVALTFGLLAVYVALNEKNKFKTLFACGAFAFACFVTYNGYWILAGLAMLISVFRKNQRLVDLIRKGALTAAGFLFPAVLIITLAAWTGTDLLDEYRNFSNSVTQGQFDEGWRLPFEYFWHAEHWIFILFALFSVYGVVSSRGKDRSINLWVGALLFIYLCLLIPSVFMHSFVVYGRLARQMMPFLILLSASGFTQLERNFPFGKQISKIILIVIAVQFAWNYRASYALTYPRELAQQAQVSYPDFHFSEKRLAFGAPTLCQNNGFIIEYVKHFEVPPESNPQVIGEILLSTPHPDNFLPYQYEGYTYEQRQYLRQLNPEMRLYKADAEFMSPANPIWPEIKSCFLKEN